MLKIISGFLKMSGNVTANKNLIDSVYNKIYRF